MRLTCKRAAGALAALALAAPASASAVPSVTSVVARTATPGVTFGTDPTGALLGSQTRYVLSSDGYAVGFAEDNAAPDGGVIDYSVLPTEYRAPATAEQKRTYPTAQTRLQAHATCAGVARLVDGPTILAWQANAGNDPSYNYVPWQKASAGLGDDPAKWIPVARGATGVDLAALSTVADFRAACARLGGTYYPADTASSIANALIANAIAPLQTQVATLQRDVATLRRARETVDRALATAREAQRAAEVAYQALFTRPIELTLAAKRFAPRHGVAMITGSATDPVTVTVEVARGVARRLGLSSPILVEANAVIGSEGAVLVSLKPDAETLALLERRLAQPARRGGRRGSRRGRAAKAANAPIPVKVLAVSGGNRDSVAAKLTR